MLDITCAAADDNDLLKPFVTRGACDIEERLLETGRAAQKRLLDSFQDAIARCRPALVLVMGEGVHLETPALSALLDAGDRVLIADLASGLRGTQAIRRHVVLSGGSAVSLELQRLPDSGYGVLCRVELTGVVAGPSPVSRSPATPASGPPPSGPPLADLTRLRASRTRALAHGEPGSGRTTALVSLAGRGQLAVLHAGDAARDGAAGWLNQLERLLAGHGGLVVVDEIQLLSPELNYLVNDAVRASTAWVAATSTPLAELGSATLGLVSLLPGRVEVPPLRSYREQIPQLLRVMAAVSGRRPRRISPAARRSGSSGPDPGKSQHERSMRWQRTKGKRPNRASPETPRAVR